MRKILATLGAVALLLTGCESEEEASCGGSSSTMCPGYDCLDCHGGFEAAGTVFSAADSTTGASGVTVTITDGDGTVLTAVTNSAGNFIFNNSNLSPPYTVVVGGQAMAGDATGACNTCHSAGSRIYP